MLLFLFFSPIFTENLILCFYKFAVMCYNCIEPKENFYVSENKTAFGAHFA